MTLHDLLMVCRDVLHCKGMFSVSGVKLEHVAPTAADNIWLSSHVNTSEACKVDPRDP